MTSVALPPHLEVVAQVRATMAGSIADIARAVSADEAVLVSASVPMTVALDAIDISRWFAAARAAGEDATYWCQPLTGRSLVGVGVAITIPLVGPGRFRQASTEWAAILERAHSGGPAVGRPMAGPILVGGASFSEMASTDACWTGFEHGRLDVPALLLATTHGTTVLTGSVVVDASTDSATSIAGLLDRLDRVNEHLASVAPLPPDQPGTVLRELGGHPDRAGWSSSVARSAGAVGRGRIDKVVLARRVDLQASAPIDVPAVLGRLGSSWEPSAAPVTVFAFGRGERTFVGASPERLVAAQGSTFQTIALAGTTGRDADRVVDARLADVLLASEKDREEHAVVVEMLRDTLAPIASRLDIDRTPHVVRLPTLQHLASEVSGELRDDRGILDLVDRLHPTPAVGGWPRAAALELLEEQEHLDRGWYAGPVGWVDANGGGEFVVAIRSGVIEGDVASLFVGCGIVGDSEPDREWAESEMKLLSLASAIGRLDR